MTVQAIKAPWVKSDDPYMAPVNAFTFRQETATDRCKEIQRNIDETSPASDIWSLGAVLYHMMSGAPPTQQDVSNKVGNVGDDDFWMKAIPSRYSAELKKVVRAMLRVDKVQRPTADDLSGNVSQGMNI